MRYVKTILMGAAALAAAVVFGGSPARANSIYPVFNNYAWNGVDYKYTYDIYLGSSATSSEIHSGTATTGSPNVQPGNSVPQVGGDFFAIYDIPGFVANSATVVATFVTKSGAQWTPTERAYGLYPTLVTYTESNLTNAVFQYVGTDGGNVGTQTIVQADTTAGKLGQISFESIYPKGNTTLFYAGQDFGATAQPPSDQANEGFVAGPTAVPVPAAAWSGLVALAGVVLRDLRRRTAGK